MFPTCKGLPSIREIDLVVLCLIAAARLSRGDIRGGEHRNPKFFLRPEIQAWILWIFWIFPQS